MFERMPELQEQAIYPETINDEYYHRKGALGLQQVGGIDPEVYHELDNNYLKTQVSIENIRTE